MSCPQHTNDDKYMYIYIYMYVYTHIYTYTHIYIYTSKYACIRLESRGASSRPSSALRSQESQSILRKHILRYIYIYTYTYIYIYIYIYIVVNKQIACGESGHMLSTFGTVGAHKFDGKNSSVGHAIYSLGNFYDKYLLITTIKYRTTNQPRGALQGAPQYYWAPCKAPGNKEKSSDFSR